MGRNKALDAAIELFTDAAPVLWDRTRWHCRTGTLEKYGGALQALRITLGDERKAKTVETLCALYLVMICQVSALSSFVVVAFGDVWKKVVRVVGT